MKNGYALLNICVRNILIGWFFLMMPSAGAQTEARHPRVAELEDQYKSKAMDFLKSRFPHLPFSVVVSIDPLRRSSKDDYVAKQEALPYYLLEDEEIRDEWDDPNASLYMLSRRIKAVQVTVSVPSTVTDEELAEIRETLVSTLRLIPARDKIEVQKRSWSGLPNFSLYAGIGIAVLLIFLAGLYLISQISLRKMTRTVVDMQAALGAKNNTPAVPPTMISTPSDEGRSKGNSGGDFRFTDPIKIREVVAARVHELLYSDEFPRLEDIVTLDRFAQRDPVSMGALVSEFPLDMQRKLFSLGKGEYWMEAFTDPGELNPICLEMLERLCRVQRSKKSKDWEALLIQVWRMDESVRVKFLRTLEQDEAMAIVHTMPKSVSVPTARQAFPGSWGVVLDPQFRSAGVSNERIKIISQTALEIHPPISFELLEIYKQEKDLISYLNVSDVSTERDIYRASPETSMIHKIRPPFYRVLQNDNGNLEHFVSRVSLDDWALALFNVNRDERGTIDQYFSSKQKFTFIEKLKALDNSNPDPRLVGQSRERVARLYFNYLQELSLSSIKESDPFSTNERVNELVSSEDKPSDVEESKDDAA